MRTPFPACRLAGVAMDVYEQEGPLFFKVRWRCSRPGGLEAGTDAPSLLPLAGAQATPAVLHCTARCCTNCSNITRYAGLHELRRTRAHEELGPPLCLAGAHAAGKQAGGRGRRVHPRLRQAGSLVPSRDLPPTISLLTGIDWARESQVLPLPRPMPAVPHHPALCVPHPGKLEPDRHLSSSLCLFLACLRFKGGCLVVRVPARARHLRHTAACVPCHAPRTLKGARLVFFVQEALGNIASTTVENLACSLLDHPLKNEVKL